MAAKFDFGAWSHHFKVKLDTLEQRQAEFDQAITSLAVAIRDQPKLEKEPPIRMAKDPLMERAKWFCHKIDKRLIGLDCRIADMPADVRRLAWRRQCKWAIMDGNKKELNALLAWYVLWRELEKGNKEVENELGKFLNRRWDDPQGNALPPV